MCVLYIQDNHKLNDTDLKKLYVFKTTQMTPDQCHIMEKTQLIRHYFERQQHHQTDRQTGVC